MLAFRDRKREQNLIKRSLKNMLETNIKAAKKFSDILEEKMISLIQDRENKWAKGKRSISKSLESCL